MRRKLALWVQRLLLLISGPQWHLNALFTELGLATYVRHRLQEGREDDLSERIAGLEEEVALLSRRLDGDAGEREPRRRQRDRPLRPWRNGTGEPPRGHDRTRRDRPRRAHPAP